MKEQSEKEKKPKMSKEKKFYLFTAIGCAAALLAIIIVAIVITNANNVQSASKPNNNSSISTPDSGDEQPNKPSEKPVVTVPEGMVAPVESASVLNDHGFYHNTTLNCYYQHVGVDFSAAAGTQVFAAEDGVVESIYKDDILLGTQITINHGNGIKTCYTFVEETEHLKVGDSVKKGDVIATVAEATGKEYKDGAHLHFEVFENGKSVDPALHLTLEEK